jgi:cytochrome oxidase Cu insertion factor (SCO1/SenC/PrrC family)
MRAGFVLGVGALALACAVSAQEPKVKPKREPGKLKVGDAATAFELADADGRNTVKLADLKGKPVVLVFGSCT